MLPRRQIAFLLFAGLAAAAESHRLPGLRAPVEILVDRWGVPHIYAQNATDLFFAQGWVAARDRLYQIDSWRRTGAGRWAEVLGPDAIPRDRFARLIRYRGDWESEWASYAPDAKAIAAAFTAGINSRIRSLNSRPAEFAKAGYDPGLWSTEDVAARMAGLVMMRNLNTEVTRAINVRQYGIEETLRRQPLDPPVRLSVPQGLDLGDLRNEILAAYRAARRSAGSGDGEADDWEGSNNWVIHGSRTATGKPILANDPHRPILIPSLRKTVHLVAPGWNAIGAGEPALPGIALGHNDSIGFGFTIVGIDQMDLVVETLNPANPNEYRDQGAWRPLTTEREWIPVKGRPPFEIELQYTVRGPVLFTDRERRKAFVLRWVGSEPGSAGYLAALRLARAQNWSEFYEAARYYKVPSENLVYADRAGNIGWIAAGAAPMRKGYDGLLPVPGGTGFDWTGHLPLERHPQLFNPSQGWIATANHNILPAGYPYVLGFEFTAPYRYQRIAEVLPSIPRHTLEDSTRLQLDLLSMRARRFQEVLIKARPTLTGRAAEMADTLASWDARVEAGSKAAAIYSVWINQTASGSLQQSAEEAWRELESRLGADPRQWTWGKLHTLELRHASGEPGWSRGPFARSGDPTTVNAAGGSNYRQKTGPSYRQVLDLADWDRSVITNIPGESGDPASPHYADLLEDWLNGRYHPLPFSRKAVEAAATERILLVPAAGARTR
jgi:penicillin amidase